MKFQSHEAAISSGYFAGAKYVNEEGEIVTEYWHTQEMADEYQGSEAPAYCVEDEKPLEKSAELLFHSRGPAGGYRAETVFAADDELQAELNARAQALADAGATSIRLATRNVREGYVLDFDYPPDAAA
ncbi:MAG: hypothetical protein ACREKE_05610 [bacterium]